MPATSRGAAETLLVRSRKGRRQQTRPVASAAVNSDSCTDAKCSYKIRNDNGVHRRKCCCVHEWAGRQTGDGRHPNCCYYLRIAMRSVQARQPPAAAARGASSLTPALNGLARGPWVQSAGTSSQSQPRGAPLGIAAAGGLRTQAAGLAGGRQRRHAGLALAAHAAANERDEPLDRTEAMRQYLNQRAAEEPLPMSAEAQEMLALAQQHAEEERRRQQAQPLTELDKKVAALQARLGAAVRAENEEQLRQQRAAYRRGSARRLQDDGLVLLGLRAKPEGRCAGRDSMHD